MTHNDLDGWLEEYGGMPLIQVLMPPSVVKLVDTLLTQAGVDIQLYPTEMPGEPPTLTAVPSGELIRRLLAGDPEPEEGADESQPGSPDTETLERLTGFYRRPVTDIPEMRPEHWRD